MVPPMPPEPHFQIDDLIAQMCLEAGRIMENASVELALTLPANRRQRTARLDRPSQAAADIVALTGAARSLQ